MKILYTITFLFFIIFFNASASIDFQKIAVEKAIFKARNENKKVLIYFTAGWCGPCKWMEQNTFTDQTITKLVSDYFVPVKVDIDSWKSNQLKKEYDIAPIPAFVILNSNGAFVNKVIGAQKPAEFINFLSSIDSINKLESVNRPTQKRGKNLILRPGIGAGITSTTLSNFQKSSQTSFRGGLFLSLDKGRVMIKPGVNFFSTGIKNQKLNYLQIPVDFGFAFIKQTIFGNQGGFKVIGGPYYSFLLNNTIFNTSNRDYGLSYGFGVFLGSHPQSAIDLIFKADQGFNDLYPQILAKQKNRIYSLSATLTLGK